MYGGILVISSFTLLKTQASPRKLKIQQNLVQNLITQAIGNKESVNVFECIVIVIMFQISFIRLPLCIQLFPAVS